MEILAHLRVHAVAWTGSRSLGKELPKLTGTILYLICVLKFRIESKS